MGFNVASGKTSVTGTVTSTSLKSVVVPIAGSQYNTTGTVTLGTVGAGKVWRIVGAALQVAFMTTNDTTVRIQANAQDICLIRGAQSSATTQQTVSTTFTGSYADAVPIAATQTVTLISGGGNVASAAVVFYIEETA